MPTLSPHDLITSRRWEHALFTTYSLSLSFFEAHLLRTGLKMTGCGDIGETPRRGAEPDARQGEIHLRSRRQPRRIDWFAIRHKLNAELGRPIRDAPTLLAVSERLDIARRTLRAHEPTLCRQIAGRHTGYAVDGWFLEDPCVGRSMVLLRFRRNGVHRLGLFTSSRVTVVGDTEIHTANSVYAIEHHLFVPLAPQQEVGE